MSTQDSQNLPPQEPQASQGLQEPQAKKPRVKRNLTAEQRQVLSTRAKESAWAKHISEFRKANPEVKGREVFQKAKESYKKPEKAPVSQA